MIVARALLGILAVLAFYALLLAASHIGEQNRCDYLRTHAPTTAAAYACGSPSGGGG